MPRFSANITFLYRELPLPDRFAAAKADGFDAVELLVTEGIPTSVLADAAANAKIDVAMCNAPMGDFLEGGAGLSAVPGRESDFRSALAEALELAQALNCKKIHIGPSRVPTGSDMESCKRCLFDNLSFAAEYFQGEGIETLIEPLNNIEMPDICLSRVSDAISMLNSVGASNVALQFDIYHVAQMEPDYIDLLREHIERIGHIQFADFPGRAEPGTGTLDFGELFSLVDKLGYEGWMGAEYQPSQLTSATLAWLR